MRKPFLINNFMLIREIEEKDNKAVGNIVQKVLMELGAPKIGTAYSDPYLFSLFEVYNNANAIYFVVEENENVIGGAGVAALENASNEICELQKMYFLPAARGKGLATILLKKCIAAAIIFGYKKCYLETMHYMEDAQKLYKKFGFYYLDKPIGNTGHTSCPVWMMKDL
jgi:putative acetyltransferase